MQEVNDILKPLRFDLWESLKNTLTRDWPHFAYYYYWVDNAIKWKLKEPNLKLNIYCPEGKYDCGVFIGIEAYSMYVVIPFAFQESKSLLHDCMTGSKLIDWSQGILLYAIHEYFENAVWGAMEYLEKTTELELYESMPGNYYFKSKSECLAVDIKVPDGFELKFLHESDVKLVHDLWPREEVKRNPEKSMNFVGTMIKLNKGMGLFTKKDGKLVSWALQNSCGGLALVQTLDEYQKKGYAKIVVSAFSKYLACEDNMDVTLFIVRGNTASEKLFTSLNYKKINTQLSMVTKPLRND